MTKKFTVDDIVSIAKTRIFVRGEIISRPLFNLENKPAEEVRIQVIFSTGKKILLISYKATEPTKDWIMHWPSLEIMDIDKKDAKEEIGNNTISDSWWNSHEEFRRSFNDIFFVGNTVNDEGYKCRKILSPTNPIVFAHLMTIYALLGNMLIGRVHSEKWIQNLYHRFTTLLSEQKDEWAKLSV